MTWRFREPAEQDDRYLEAHDRGNPCFEGVRRDEPVCGRASKRFGLLIRWVEAAWKLGVIGRERHQENNHLELTAMPIEIKYREPR